MTIVGKILVFVNLVFSLVVGYLAVMTYTARVHYAKGFDELNKQYTVVKAVNDQLYSDAQKAKADADTRVAGSEAALKSLRDEIDGYKTQIKAANDKATKAEALVAQAAAEKEALAADVKRRQADVEKIRETLAKEINEGIALKKETNEMRDRAVKAEIDAKALKDINLRMEAQFQETQKDVARMKANLGTGGKVMVSGGANPPPENVEGLVKVADSSGLLQLNIGSDAGLVKGHTLELFRLSNVPSQSKYLGRVRIVDVTPHEAVAQPYGAQTGKAQAGDRVASRILGG